MKGTRLMKTVKKAAALITSFLMAASVAVIPMFAADVQKGESIFKDVTENDWFCDDVKFAYDNKIIKGITEDMFAPDTSLSRAMAATMLYRMAGEPEITDDSTTLFHDIDKNGWYFDAVVWGKDNNIIRGYSLITFAPNDNITRADFAVMLLRYASQKNLSLPGDDNNKYEFKDSSENPYYSKLAVDILHNAEVIKGKTAETFAPKDEITRAEASAMLHRFSEGTIENKSTLLSKYGFEINAVTEYSNRMPILADGSFDKEDYHRDILLIRLNKIYDETAPECEVTAKISRADSSDISIKLKANLDEPLFYGTANVKPDLIEGEILRARITITIGEETETLVYYLISEIVC